MSGGIQEGIYDLKNYNEKNLWTVLTKAKSNGSLMGCSINVKHILFDCLFKYNSNNILKG